MALSDQEIKTALAHDHIFIYPFDPDQITSCAYDVRLGPYVIRAKATEATPQNPWNRFYDYWARPERPQVADATTAELYHLALGEEYHIIQPGELMLGHTIEWIGGRYNMTTKLQARSSMARIGITICSCAGLGDVGFTNRWCVEIRNSSLIPLVLPVGKRIGQIMFIPLGTCDQSYADGGHYQTSSDPWLTVKTWTPDQLYPQLWRNRDASWTTAQVEALVTAVP